MTGHISFLRIPLIIFKIVITVSLIVHCKKDTIISVVLDALNIARSIILHLILYRNNNNCISNNNM